MSVVVLRGGARAHALSGALGVSARDAAAWLREHDGVIKDDKHSLVAIAQLQGKPYFFKHYRNKSALHAILLRCQWSRGIRAFDHALALADQGFSVPNPLACLRVPGGLLLVTEFLLGQDLKTLWQQNPALVAELDLLAKCGALLASLHRAGYSHGDCKWSNVLWSETRLYFLDLEAVARSAPGGTGQTQDLARFTVNAEDFGVDMASYRQFLAAYCGGMAVSETVIIDQIMPRLRKLRGRHQRKYGERGAPLL